MTKTYYRLVDVQKNIYPSSVSRTVSSKQKVILDANALLMPFQFGVNLDLELERLVGECDVLVPSSVLGELRKLVGTDKHAKAALDLAQKYEVREVEDSGDASILSLAGKEAGIVVTNDRELIQKLRESGIPVISLRSRTHLVIEGHI
ncbi:MAG: twitching motility protein PilT [Methanobacteriota archaeon]|nr:MAG: twitching motility protein PilT [Euryarchaeota archaeon]